VFQAFWKDFRTLTSYFSSSILKKIILLFQKLLDLKRWHCVGSEKPYRTDKLSRSSTFFFFRMLECLKVLIFSSSSLFILIEGSKIHLRALSWALSIYEPNIYLSWQEIEFEKSILSIPQVKLCTSLIFIKYVSLKSHDSLAWGEATICASMVEVLICLRSTVESLAVD